MPPARELSSSEIEEILAARDSGETVADVRKRFQIGTNRLYRIWKEHNAIPPSATKQAASAIAATPKKDASAIAATPKKDASAMAATPKKAGTSTETDLLYQILYNVQDLQKDMGVLLQESGSEDLEESDSEDLEDLGADLQGFEEKEDGMLWNIERNCKTVREKTDAIVAVANAGKSAVVGILQVVGIAFGIVAAGIAVLPFVWQN